MGKKVIALLLALFLTVPSIVTASTPTSAEILNDMGLLLNITEVELDAVLTRDVGVTMILKSLGYTQRDADNAASNNQFDDVVGWAKGWAELAYTTGITTGISEGSFDPTGILTEKQFVAFQLRALGYNSNDSWNEAVVLGKSSGLINEESTLEDISYTKREASEVMFNALSSRVVGTDQKLVNQLIEAGIVNETKAQSYGLLSSDFEVVNKQYDNLKLIRIDFSGNLDGDTISGTTVDVVKNSLDLVYDADATDGVPANKYAVDMVEDDSINLLFGTPLNQGDTITLTINGLKDLNGQLIEDYTTVMPVKDNTEPTIETIEGINQYYAKVTFSEPVQFFAGSRVYDNLKLDGERLAATTQLSYDGMTVTIEFAEELDEKPHTLSIEGIEDYAGYTNVNFTGSFTVTEDNEVPFVQEAYATDRDTVIVIFNEDILTEDGDITIKGYKYDLDDEDKVSVIGPKVTINLDSPLPASAANSPVTGTYDDVEDLLENKQKNDTDFTFLAVKDSTPPTLTAEVNDSNQIILHFSEDITIFTTNYFVVSKLDEDDEEQLVGIQSLVAIDGSKRDYKVTLVTPQINEEVYTLKVMAVKDNSVYQNRLTETEIELLMNDLKQPEVSTAKLLANDVVRVTFTESMDPESLLDEDNYAYYDKSKDETIPLEDIEDFDMTADPDYEYVDIYIPGVVSSDKIIIDKVRDPSGTLIKNYGAKKTIQDSDDFEATDLKAELTDLKTIKLTATGHEFDIINANDFIVRTLTGDSKYHYIRSAVIDSDDPSIAYLTLNANLETNGQYDGDKQYLYLADETVTQDTYGADLEILYKSPLLIEDGVKPTVSVDLDTTDTVIIEFSEVVSAASDADVLSDILFRDKDGDMVTLTFGGNLSYSGGNNSHNFFDTLTITGLNGGDEYSLEVKARFIRDESDNTIIEFSKTSFTVED